MVLVILKAQPDILMTTGYRKIQVRIELHGSQTNCLKDWTPVCVIDSWQLAY
jgi:hypothetical protein